MSDKVTVQFPSLIHQCSQDNLRWHSEFEVFFFTVAYWSETLILYLSSLCPDYSFPEAKSFTHTHGFTSRSMIHTPSRVMAVSTTCQYPMIHARSHFKELSVRDLKNALALGHVWCSLGERKVEACTFKVSCRFSSLISLQEEVVCFGILYCGNRAWQCDCVRIYCSLPARKL